MININMDNYKTDDILLTAYCLTQGINLIEIIHDYPNHFTFCLLGENECKELKQKYLNNAPAPALELFSKREMLLSEIKSRNRNGDSQRGSY